MEFKKENELIPAIVQDADTLEVLMLGYMNREAFEKTLEIKKITFFSRSKNRLWTKGETSGNFLLLRNYYWDCDNDTLLFMVQKTGPVCHTGQLNCFGYSPTKSFFFELEEIIGKRMEANNENSYVANLTKKGIAKISQKVGEEAVELVIEAMKDSEIDFKNEAADLLFHFQILCKAKSISLETVIEVLKERKEQSKNTIV